MDFLLFHVQELIHLWFEKCLYAHDLRLLCFCSTAKPQHNLIKNFFFFWKGNKALPLSSFKFNDLRLDEWARCKYVYEGGSNRERHRERGGAWLSEWATVVFCGINYVSCKVWEHLICSAVVMARSTAIHMSAEVPASRKIKSSTGALFSTFCQMQEQNWYVPQMPGILQRHIILLFTAIYSGSSRIYGMFLDSNLSGFFLLKCVTKGMLWRWLCEAGLREKEREEERVQEGQGEVMATPAAVFMWFTAPSPDNSLWSSRRSVMRNSWSGDLRFQLSPASSLCHSCMPSTHTSDTPSPRTKQCILLVCLHLSKQLLLSSLNKESIRVNT